MFRSSRIATVTGLLVLLLSSMVFVWNNSDAPLFGYQHDDGVYYVTAKAIASGQGYVIPSLPGSPAQTKYPPALPLLLSLAWLANPVFPANLRIASWIMWIWLPLLLGVSFVFWQRLGFTGWRRWLLAAMLSLNAYILYFTSTFLSEIPFAVYAPADAYAPTVDGTDVCECLMALGLSASRGAAKRLLEHGGISVNGVKLGAADRMVSRERLLLGGYALVRKGARDYGLVQVPR